MNLRLKKLRKRLGLSQEAFANRLGMKGSSISLLESGNRNITEPVIRSICREFNVDYIWLTTGAGEMFVDSSDDDVISTIEHIMESENEFYKKIFRSLSKLDDEDILDIERIINKLLSGS